MRQIWSYAPTCKGATHLMAHRAWSRKKHLLSGNGFGCRRLGARFQLRLQPRRIRFRILNDCEQTHVRVLRTTEFRALPFIDDGFRRLQPYVIRYTRYEVHFAVKRRNPERMHYVFGYDFDIDRASGRKMKFICRSKLL